MGSGIIKITPQGDTLHYTEGEGLTNDYVEDVGFDINGDIWFATADGLSRFDGLKWHSYLKSVYPFILNNYQYFSDISKDAQGNLWFISKKFSAENNMVFDQIHKFNGQTLTLVNSTNEQHSLLNKIECTQENNIYIGKSGNGLWKLVNNQLISVPSLENKSISAFKCDLNNVLWVGVENKIYKLKNDIINDSILFEKLESSFNNIQLIFFDKDQRLYVDINSDIIIYDNSTLTRTGFYYSTNAICQLSSGDILYGYRDGFLNRKHGNKITSRLLDYTKINSRYIPSIDIDLTGKKYLTFGNSEKEGFALFHNDRWYYYDINPDLPEYIMVDSKSEVWGLDQQSKIYNLRKNQSQIVFNRDSAKSEEYFSPGSKIIEDIKSDLWIGGYKNIYRYDRYKWESYHPITDSILDISSSCIDIFDNKWFLSFHDYLLRYNNKTWERINLPFKIGNHYNIIESDHLGRIWIATSENGLWVYNGKSWIVYNSSNKLKNDIITGLVIERELGLVWVLSNFQTARFDGTNWDYPLEKQDLKNVFLTTLKRDIDNTFWIGTLNRGLYHWKEGDSIILNNETTTDTEILNEKEFLAYPNPVQTSLFFKSKNPVTEIKIYNSIGELMFYRELSTHNHIEIPINILKNHTLYFYKAMDANNIEHFGKFIYLK